MQGGGASIPAVPPPSSSNYGKAQVMDNEAGGETSEVFDEEAFLLSADGDKTEAKALLRDSLEEARERMRSTIDGLSKRDWDTIMIGVASLQGLAIEMHAGLMKESAGKAVHLAASGRMNELAEAVEGISKSLSQLEQKLREKDWL
jgi:hypothetical protein